MRQSWLVLTLLFSLTACTNAVFRGKNGSSSSADSTTVPTESDATQKLPDPINSIPPTEVPNTLDPNLDPNGMPCPVALVPVLASLYQLHDDPCMNPEDDDDSMDGGNGADDDDDDDDDDVDDDDDDGKSTPPPGDQPGQNS